jgi:hypothetical protein
MEAGCDVQPDMHGTSCKVLNALALVWLSVAVA